MPRRVVLIVSLFTATLALGQQQRVFYSGGAHEKLRGPVRTVQEETTSYEEISSGAKVGSRYTVYDGKGHLLEDSRYDADGKILMHTKFTRDQSGRTLRREISGPDTDRTIVQTYNGSGLASRETYDSNGAQMDKTQIHTSPAGDTTFTTRTQKPDGSVSVSRSMETTDPATGTKHQSIVKDGESERETLIQQNAKGEMRSEAMLFFDNTSILSETLPDGSVKAHFYHPTTKTNIYTTTDQHHRLVEQVEDAPDRYSKTTYRYDDDGRLIETATFDRSGKPTGKTVMKYQLDSFGNWTEQETLTWEPKMKAKPLQLKSLTKRVISYY